MRFNNVAPKEQEKGGFGPNYGKLFMLVRNVWTFCFYSIFEHRNQRCNQFLEVFKYSAYEVVRTGYAGDLKLPQT